MTTQYPKIENEEIQQAAEHNPQQALLMLLANSTLAEAEAQAGGRAHTPEFHEAGWALALETSQGVVGLWSCWLRNQFFLGYPLFAPQIPDSWIMDTLGVEPAKEVLQVDATAVEEGREESEWKDADKPLERNSIGQTVAYRTRGMRRWADFYGPKVEGGGRVWIESSQFNSYGHHFRLVRSHELGEISYGHDRSHSIATTSFNFYNRYAVEGPRADEVAVQPYLDKFLALACKIGNRGTVRAVNIDYGFVLVPEQLPALGYENITWLKGRPGFRQGWGEEVVRATKGDEIVILVSGNSIVPWSTVRRVLVNKPNAATLRGLLTF